MWHHHKTLDLHPWLFYFVKVLWWSWLLLPPCHLRFCSFTVVVFIKLTWVWKENTLWLSLKTFLHVTFRGRILRGMAHMFGNSMGFLCSFIVKQFVLNYFGGFFLIKKNHRSLMLEEILKWVQSLYVQTGNCGPWVACPRSHSYLVAYSRL